VLGSTQAVISAVAAGAGIAFVSSLAVKKGPSSPVRQVPVRGIRLDRDFYCIYRREKTTPRLYEEFSNFMQIETSHNG